MQHDFNNNDLQSDGPVWQRLDIESVALNIGTMHIIYVYMGTYLVQTTTLWKPVQTTAKKSSKFTKKITHVDDMMLYNLVKYLVQTRLCLWDIKITIFQARKLSRWFVRNLLILYLTNEVEFEKDILQNCVSSYHLYVWFLAAIA